jgi:signal transduction histidine kinase
VSFFDPNAYLRRLERLVEVCRNLGKSEAVEHLLQQIVNAACDLTGSMYSFLFIYEQETDLLKIAAGPLENRESLARIRVPIEKSLTGGVYSKAKPITINNAQTDPRMFHDMERVLRYTTQAICAAPVIFRGKTIGVLETVNKRDKSPYNEDDLIILETLASQAAIATLSTSLIEETENAYTEAQELDQMKNNFIAIASHELRTPLGLVLGHATFLRELISDEQQRSQVEIIIRNATKLKTIIEELANIDGFQTGSARIRVKTVTINALVQKICDLYLEQARQQDIHIQTNLLKQELRIEGDEEKLGIAISNLIKNALIFTNPQGNVSVSLEALPEFVQITVADDGIGIPENELPKIFDRFYQVQSHLTRKHGGMGLGLSVTKAMVEMHKGKIWVDSIEGYGSKFSILLPISNEQNPIRKI